MDKPFVHLIKLHKEVYLFDVNTNMLCKVNERIYEYLLNGKKEVLNADDKMIIKNMKKNGMLQTNKIEKIEHPMTEIVEDLLEII